MAALLAPLLLAITLTAAGCSNDPVAPPLPTAVEIIDTLRAEGIPIGPTATGAALGCDLGSELNDSGCHDRLAFRDDRSGVTPGSAGYNPPHSGVFGGAVEVWKDTETARRRGQQLQRFYDRFPDIAFAVATAGPIVLDLGNGLLEELGPTYTATDYRDALDRRYGPITFTAAIFGTRPTTTPTPG